MIINSSNSYFRLKSIRQHIHAGFPSSNRRSCFSRGVLFYCMWTKSGTNSEWWQKEEDELKEKTLHSFHVCHFRNHFISEWEKPNNCWPCSKVSAPFWSKQDLVNESGYSGIMTEADSWRVSWSPQLAIALSKTCLGYKVNSLTESPRSRYKAEDIVIKLTSNTVIIVDFKGCAAIPSINNYYDLRVPMMHVQWRIQCIIRSS